MALRAFNLLSLCSGAGGLDLGVELAVPGASAVAYVEREARAAASLVARMADKALDEAPVWDDLATFDGRPWRGVVDCVTAGYPCQPFSAAGKRLGADDPRHLWPHVARIIRECEPEYVFLENVAAHLTLGFAEVRAELRGMGFHVEAGLYTAAEIGASHERKRLFVLARQQRGVDQVNPPGERRQGKLLPARPRAEGQGTPDADRRGHLVGVALGNAHGQGLEGRGMRRVQRPDQRHSRSASLPLFPPYRNDFGGWARALAIDPTLEPAVCRMADGVADRVDRLRIGGNGVVPMEAAFAFSTLWHRLHG